MKLQTPNPTQVLLVQRQQLIEQTQMLSNQLQPLAVQIQQYQQYIQQVGNDKKVVKEYRQAVRRYNSIMTTIQHNNNRVANLTLRINNANAKMAYQEARFEMSQSMRGTKQPKRRYY